MLTALVREFHRKHDFAVNESMKTQPSPTMHATVRVMSDESDAQLELFKSTGNMVNLRAHLILEEVAETLAALDLCDDQMLLDGLADSVYVLAGTAVAFGLPLDEALLEVHRSNMTKASAREREAAPESDPRLRNKGPNYVPPRIGGVLAFHASFGAKP